MMYLSETEATTDQGNRRLRDSGVSFGFQAVPSADGAIFQGWVRGHALPEKFENLTY